MPRKGKRKWIAKYCFEDGNGRSCIVPDPITGRQKEFRFPKHTAVSEMRREAEAWQRTRGPKVRRVRDQHSLRAAVERWEKLERHLQSWRERRAELRAWVKLYGDRRFTSLQEEDVRAAMSTWATAGVKPKTIRNRMWSLKHLYAVLYGKDYPTPVDHVSPPAKVRHVITPTPESVILAVYHKLIEAEQKGLLRDAKTRARFMVRAASGRRPCEIMWAKPEDVSLELRYWRVRDAKGGFTPGGLYLNDDLLAAWTLFIEADAWGYFETSSMARVLRNAGWPKGVRPYNLRHSLGIALSESGADFRDVADQLGHRDERTTRQSYVPALNSRMVKAAKMIEGRLKWSESPSTSPFSEGPERANACQTKDQTKTTRPRGKPKNQRDSTA